jgi:hypothetical protein
MKEDILDRYALNNLTDKDQVWLKQELDNNPDFQKELDLHLDIVEGLNVHMNSLFDIALEQIAPFAKEVFQDKIKQVDSELEKDGFFNETLLEKDLIESIQVHGERELKNTIQKVEVELTKEGFFEEKSNPNYTPIYSLLKVTLATASILLILTFGWQYISNNEVTNPASLEFNNSLAAHYENTLTKKANLELTEMGFAGNPEEEPLQELILAMKTYDSKDYSTASQMLETLLKKEIDKDFKNQTELYLAVSYLLNNEVNRAITLFDELLKTNSLSEEQKETCTWYFALAQLKNKNFDLAKTQLKKLKSSTIYSNQALKLLNKLK